MDIHSQIISLAKRRGIFLPSYNIYGGEAGFYDYGPLGVALKHNIERLWRKFYVLQEQCMEISTPVITPYNVFKASGHVDKFQDAIVSCKKCRATFKAEELTKDQLTSLECPDCGELLEKGYMSLMFNTQIGAVNKEDAFLRPETAQGIFVNFPLLYQLARKKIPFGVVQVGKGFRNEVSPRQALFRLREFSMAEAEVFFDPENKTHERFSQVGDDIITVIPAEKPEQVSTVGQLVSTGSIGNQALAYYIALTQRFLLGAGINGDNLRFRQHEQREMAHYAEDCWDAEIQTSLGWIECVGIADRTAYDLKAHMEATGADMTAFSAYSGSVTQRRQRIEPKMGVLGPVYKEKAKDIQEKLAQMEPPKEGDIHLTIDGEDIVVGPECYQIVEDEVTASGKNFIPHVIEPSYGIDRILYSILEHNYVQEEKDGETYVTLRLPAHIAPVTVGVFPLVNKNGLLGIAQELQCELRSLGIMAYFDNGGSIGRRYARMDEIGTPFSITVDYQTLNDDTVTVRWRDTTKQVRVKKEKLAEWLKENIEVT